MTEHSPVGYTEAEQAAVHDELKEFLGSDDDSGDDEDDEDYMEEEDEDEDEDGGEGEDDDDNAANGKETTEGAAALQSPGWRKRKREKDDEAEYDTEGSSFTHLAQRMKNNLPEDSQAKQRNDDVVVPPVSQGESGPTEDADFDEDELEREMLEAFGQDT